MSAIFCIKLVHWTGGGASPTGTVAECIAQAVQICTRHPRAYIACSVPYPVGLSRHGLIDVAMPPAIDGVLGEMYRSGS